MVKTIVKKINLSYALFIRNRLKDRFLPKEDGLQISDEHQSRIKIYRNNLIKIIILGFLLVFCWPLFSGNWYGYQINVNSEDDKKTETPEQDTTPVMLKPRFYGEDENKQLYYIEAISAVSVTDDKLILYKISGNMMLNDKSVIEVNSENGDYTMSKKSLNLTDGVKITSDKGYILNTNSANINVENKLVTGVEKVKIVSNLGDITANGFTIQNTGDVIEFFGNVELYAFLEPEKNKK
jgi:hypothetical protein